MLPPRARSSSCISGRRKDETFVWVRQGTKGEHPAYLLEKNGDSCIIRWAIHGYISTVDSSSVFVQTGKRVRRKPKLMVEEVDEKDVNRVLPEPSPVSNSSCSFSKPSPDESKNAFPRYFEDEVNLCGALRVLSAADSLAKVRSDAEKCRKIATLLRY